MCCHSRALKFCLASDTLIKLSGLEKLDKLDHVVYRRVVQNKELTKTEQDLVEHHSKKGFYSGFKKTFKKIDFCIVFLSKRWVLPSCKFRKYPLIVYLQRNVHRLSAHVPSFVLLKVY